MNENCYYIWNENETNKTKLNEIEIHTSIFKSGDPLAVANSSFPRQHTNEKHFQTWNENNLNNENEIDIKPTTDSPIVSDELPTNHTQTDAETEIAINDVKNDFVIKTVSFQGKKPPQCVLTIIKNIYNYVKINNIRGLTNARMLSDATGLAYNNVKRIINGKAIVECSKELEKCKNNQGTGSRKKKFAGKTRRQKKITATNCVDNGQKVATPRKVTKKKEMKIISKSETKLQSPKTEAASDLC